MSINIRYHYKSVNKSCTCPLEDNSTLRFQFSTHSPTTNTKPSTIPSAKSGFGKSRGVEDCSDVDTSDKTDNDGDDRADVGWGGGEDGAGGGGASDRVREVGHPPDIEGDDDERGNADVELDIPGAEDNGEAEGGPAGAAAAAGAEEEEEEEEDDEEELLLFSDSCGAANTANDNSTLATPTEEDADDENEENSSTSGAVAAAVVEQERLREEENLEDEIPAPLLESSLLETADLEPEVEAAIAPSPQESPVREEEAPGDSSIGEKMVAMESAHMVS